MTGFLSEESMAKDGFFSNFEPLLTHGSLFRKELAYVAHAFGGKGRDADKDSHFVLRGRNARMIRVVDSSR